jgi:hypothetical protein
MHRKSFIKARAIDVPFPSGRNEGASTFVEWLKIATFAVLANGTGYDKQKRVGKNVSIFPKLL